MDHSNDLHVDETNSPTGRSARMAQEYILVEAGHKEEVASRLVTKRHQPYSREKLVDLCEHVTST